MAVRIGERRDAIKMNVARGMDYAAKFFVISINVAFLMITR
jgi:hypothetical protein